MATSYPKSDYRVFRKSKFAPPAQDNNRVVTKYKRRYSVWRNKAADISKSEAVQGHLANRQVMSATSDSQGRLTATRMRGSPHADTPTELVFAFVSIVFCMWWVSQPPSPSTKRRWRMVMVLRDGNLLNLSTVSGRDLRHLGHADFGLGRVTRTVTYKYKHNLPKAVHHLCCKISDCPWHASLCLGVAEIKKKKGALNISREHLNYSHIHLVITSLSNLLSCLPVTWGICYLFFCCMS